MPKSDSRYQNLLRQWQEMSNQEGQHLKQIQVLEDERDALARDLETERHHRRAVEESEQALAAHAKRLGEVLFDTFAALEDGDTSAIPYDTYRGAYNDAPATSLARLIAKKQAEALNRLPATCDGKEQDAFEAHILSRGLPLTGHPLHYLFMDERTHAARQAWRAAIEYCRRQAEEAP